MTGAPPTTDSLLSEARTWLSSPDGRRTAERLLRRYRLHGADVILAAEDLLAETLERFWRRISGKSDSLATANIPAYLTRVMQHCLTDAWRGSRKAAVAVDAIDDDRETVFLDSPDVPDPGSGPLLRKMRNLIESLDGDAWAKAAALVYLTLLGEPDAMTTGVPIPRPRRGATPAEAAMWTALWIAGRRDLFPTVGDDTPKHRQRRSRAGQKVRALIDAATARIVVDSDREGLA